MKYSPVLVCLLLTAIATPTLSLAQEDPNECAAKGEKIVKPAERQAFMKSCLAETGTSEKNAKRSQMDKERHCNANAKSMKLEGKKKTEYLNHCYHEDDLKGSAKEHPKM